MYWINFLNMCPSNISQYGAVNFKQPVFDEILHLQKYINIFNNRFEYKNLPESFKSVSGKHNLFSTMLFFAPAVAIFKDETLGVQVLPTTGGFNYDIAGNPTSWEVFGMNGYRRKLDNTNSVLMINDYAFSIPFLQVMYNLRLMLECDRTHKQNLIAQRQPLIMEMEEDEKKSANVFINKVKEFADTIMVRVRSKDDSKRSSPYNTQAFQSGRQFEGDKLGADYRYFENRIYTYLGYNNENVEKKERLLVDEINANNSVINSFYTSALECQKTAFENANKMFGTNMQVEPKEMVGIMSKKENNNDKSITIPEEPTT